MIKKSEIKHNSTAIMEQYYQYITYQKQDDKITKTYTTNDVKTHTIKFAQCQDVYQYTYEMYGLISLILKNGIIHKSYFYNERNELENENDMIINLRHQYQYDNYGNISLFKKYQQGAAEPHEKKEIYI